MKYHILKNAIKLLIVRSLPTVCEIGNFFSEKMQEIFTLHDGPQKFSKFGAPSDAKGSFSAQIWTEDSLLRASMKKNIVRYSYRNNAIACMRQK